MTVKTETGNWKSGTEALAICTICGAEYEVGKETCPDCNVSLSVVRRCPGCHRIVSAQHAKCVHCHTLFLSELPTQYVPSPAAYGSARASSLAEQRFRAVVVSAITFAVVFLLGFVFIRQMNRPAVSVRVIANSHVLHSADLRRASSLSSSVIDKAAPGTIVNITGYRSGDQERRWLVVEWNNAPAYVLMYDLAPPKAIDAEEGANVLKFYLLGMEANSVDDAVSSVDYYKQIFPGDVHGEELRWILAERIRSLAQHGVIEESKLRRQAHQQYEALVASSGGYVEKARDILAKLPMPSASEAVRRAPLRKSDGVQVVGGASTQTSTTK